MKENLSELYPVTSEDEHIDAIVRLCLTDSQFPAYVAKVDASLQKILAEEHGGD